MRISLAFLAASCFGLSCFAMCPSMDATGDCFVDLEDLAVLTSQWLTGDNGAPADMVLLSGGTFQMGDSFSEGGSEELPLHTVTLDSFYMGRHEITNLQYCIFLNSALSQGLITVYPAVNIVYQAGSGTNFPYCNTYTSVSSPNQIDYASGSFIVHTKNGRSMANDPMVSVSWFGAAAYCNWRSQQEGKEPCYDLSTWACDFGSNGYRLATEAQWEYAARGGLSGRRFPWGDTISQTQANFYSYAYAYDLSPVKNQYHPIWADQTYPYTAPVGFFSGALRYKYDYNWLSIVTSYQTADGVNGYGLDDMAGNAREWCNDWYSSAYYSSSPSNNPTGPASGSYRVLRGGSWGTDAADCRVADRYNLPRDSRDITVGLRIVLPN